MDWFGFRFGLVFSFLGIFLAASSARADIPVLELSEKLSRLAATDFTDKNCIPILRPLNNELLHSSPNRFDSRELDSVEVVNQVFRSLSTSGSRFRNLGRNWDRNGSWSGGSVDCRAEFFRMERSIRILEEHLRIVVMGHFGIPIQKRKDIPFFSSLDEQGIEGLSLTVNEKFRHQELYQAGDVILMRGTTSLSGSIASVATIDTQFSHIAMIGSDERGNRLVIEALVESPNLRVTPLEEYFKKPHGMRGMLWRHPRPDIALLAAKNAYIRAIGPRPSPYNPSMKWNMENLDPDQFYCTQLVAWAFNRAAQELTLPPVWTPQMKSKIPMSSYLVYDDMIGIHSDEVFVPTDVMKADYELVAEFRNPHRIKEAWMSDAVFREYYRWIEEEGYRFDLGFPGRHRPWSKIKLAAIGLFWHLRYVPGIHQFLERVDFPMDIPKTGIQWMALVDEMSKEIIDFVAKKEAEIVETQGYGFSFFELMTIARNFLEIDGFLYEHHSRNQVHAYFNRCAEALQ